jgi:hypothetical protein
MKLGLGVPEILLPRKEVDLRKWAVIACDQFTQDHSYWENVRAEAGGLPSALNLIFPEVYLEAGGAPARDRVDRIHHSMRTYLESGVFVPPRRGWIYLERRSPHNEKRRGLLLTLDLERYDWRPDSRPLIRSTEGTLPERLPPRMDVRRNAPLEIPHILILIDDQEDALLPALGDMARQGAPLYDTPLMMGSGGVKGWALDSPEAWDFLAGGLEALVEKSASRYEVPEPFLYAVGDGNHSLAAAKGIWEEYKAAHAGEAGLEDHPLRWALVELENIYDPGIRFEPIHRVIFGAGEGELREALSRLPDFSIRPLSSGDEVSRLLAETVPGNRLGLVRAEKSGGFGFSLIETGARGFLTAALQPLLDGFIAAGSGAASGGGKPSMMTPSIDYIHGGEELFRVVRAAPPERKALGLLLPPIRKDGLFKTVAVSGPLPRKSFSMGEAVEKRFYLESRRL